MAQTLDVTHSEISFIVRHLVFAKVRGQFTKWSGTVSYNQADPTKSKVEVEIDVASINTRDEKRDAHLTSPDFFDAATFPKITFKSKRVESAGKEQFKLVGDLKIRDVTKEVTLDVEHTGGGKDPWGNQRQGFSLKGSILREQFGVKWNQVLEAGGLAVSDKVDIEAEVQVMETAPAATAGVTA